MRIGVSEAKRIDQSRVSARTIGAIQSEKINPFKYIQVFNVLQTFCYEDTITTTLLGAWCRGPKATAVQYLFEAIYE